MHPELHGGSAPTVRGRVPSRHGPGPGAWQEGAGALSPQQGPCLLLWVWGQLPAGGTAKGAAGRGSQEGPQRPAPRPTAAQDLGDLADVESDSSLGTSPRPRPASGCGKQESPRGAGAPEREEEGCVKEPQRMFGTGRKWWLLSVCVHPCGVEPALRLGVLACVNLGDLTAWAEGVPAL